MDDVQIYKPAEYGPRRDAAGEECDGERNVLVLHDVVDTRFNNDGYVTQPTTRRRRPIGSPLGETASQFVSTTTTTRGR